jgi:hypothetical protein
MPLNGRFLIDRTSNACRGEFEHAISVASPMKPGWRTSGWARDNKAGASPRYVVLADNAGMVAGVALAGFPEATRWMGYVNGQPRSVTAYLVESDGRSLCAIGTRFLTHPGTEVAFVQLAARLPDSVPGITGAWVADGYFKGARDPGAPPVIGPVFGSYPDAGT